MFAVNGVIFDPIGEELFYFRYRRGLKIPTSEILPASLDPAGNWGEPKDGIQVSLRFRRSEWLAGESVRAIVILRNVGPVSKELLLTNAPGYWFGSHFNISGQSQKAVSFTSAERSRFRDVNSRSDVDVNGMPWIGMTSFDLSVKGERWFVVDLNKMFDLKPDTYMIQARLPVLVSSNQPPAFEAVSASVKIKIVEKLSPTGLEEKQKWENTIADINHLFYERFTPRLNAGTNTPALNRR